MPRLSGHLPFEEVFTVEESARLERCVIPQQMEDKWLVLYDETVLRFYRSWTGIQVYSVVLVTMDPDSDGPVQYVAADAVVNRDPKEYVPGDDELEAARLRWLIRTLVLEQDVPLPQDPSLAGDDALLAAWGFAGSAGFAAPGPDAGTVGEDDAAPEDGASPTGTEPPSGTVP